VARVADEEDLVVVERAGEGRVGDRGDGARRPRAGRDDARRPLVARRPARDLRGPAVDEAAERCGEDARLLPPRLFDDARRDVVDADCSRP
jgi:hypothetical protein